MIFYVWCVILHLFCFIVSIYSSCCVFSYYCWLALSISITSLLQFCTCQPRRNYSVNLGVECVYNFENMPGVGLLLKLAMYFCLQDNFSDCRSLSDCRCDKECISHEVPGDDLCSELLLWIVTEGCFYYWSNICGCNHDSKRVLLHVLHQGDYYSGSSEGKSSKLKYWDGWVCIERIHLGNVIDGYQVLH